MYIVTAMKDASEEEATRNLMEAPWASERQARQIKAAWDQNEFRSEALQLIISPSRMNFLIVSWSIASCPSIQLLYVLFPTMPSHTPLIQEGPVSQAVVSVCALSLMQMSPKSPCAFFAYVHLFLRANRLPGEYMRNGSVNGVYSYATTVPWKRNRDK